MRSKWQSFGGDRRGWEKGECRPHVLEPQTESVGGSGPSGRPLPLATWDGRVCGRGLHLCSHPQGPPPGSLDLLCSSGICGWLLPPVPPNLPRLTPALPLHQPTSYPWANSSLVIPPPVFNPVLPALPCPPLFCPPALRPPSNPGSVEVVRTKLSLA